jgi:hypothetical protein
MRKAGGLAGGGEREGERGRGRALPTNKIQLPTKFNYQQNSTTNKIQLPTKFTPYQQNSTTNKIHLPTKFNR